MRQPGKKDLKSTHSFSLHDLKVYQESHKTLKDVRSLYRQLMIQVHVTEQLNVLKSSLREEIWLKVKVFKC